MTLSRTLGIALRLLLILVISSPFIVTLLVIQTERAVPSSSTLNTTELDVIERLLLDAAPSSTAQVSQQTAELNSGELNLLLRYGLQVLNLAPQWTGEVELEPGLMRLNLSIAMSNNSLPIYLNLQGNLRSAGTQFELGEATVGNLALPQAVTAFIATRLEDNLLAADVGFQDIRDLIANIDSAQINSDSLQLVVNWEPDLIDRLANRTRQLFVPEEDRLRIVAYYNEIGRIVATIPTDLRAVSLNTFLVPLFDHAAEQSAISGNPIAENRTALQALALYVNNEDIEQLVGSDLAAEIEAPPFIEVRLQRRQDLAQHLVSIAAISASAGAGVGELLSTTKEAYDARYRSGFSFSDLTANSVGVTLATYATRDENSALLIQQRLRAIENESDYMPQVGNNRDGLSEADFATLYRDRNSAEYEQRLVDIQALIDSRPIFNGLD
ncbi:MAG: hypothetical protein RL839_15855 [Gammaproteobacteria bacterium]